MVFGDIAVSANSGKLLFVFFVIPCFEFVDGDFVLFFPSIEKVGNDFAMRATVAPVVFKFGGWVFDGGGGGSVTSGKEDDANNDDDNCCGNDCEKTFVHGFCIIAHKDNGDNEWDYRQT